jgi:hypothetical protein
MNQAGYKRLASSELYMPLGDELETNYTLSDVAKRLGLGYLLDVPASAVRDHASHGNGLRI